MKRIKWVGSLGILLFGIFTFFQPSGIQARETGKYLIILQAGKGTHEGMARTLHAFLYSRELKEKGNEVVLVFDGAGTEWAAELTNPLSKSKLKPMFDEFRAMKGVPEIICDYCSDAFGVKEEFEGREVTLDGEYKGHPSITRWTDEGYQVVIL